jgi:TonB family protein
MSAQIHQASMASGRSLVFMATVALHVAAISALMAWRISEVTSKASMERLVVSQLEQPKQKELVRPIESTVKLERIRVPTPEASQVPVPLPEESVLLGDPVSTSVPVVTGSSDPGMPVAVIPETPLRFRAVRPSDDYYPPNAIRLEQQGMVIVRACVDAAGRLAGAPRVVTASRYRLLDDAAIAWAGEALRFTPATRGGIAVGACKDFRVNFTLH